MIDPIELLYMPIQPFVWHPERAFFIALIFLIMLIVIFLRKRKNQRIKIWATALAVIIWVIFGVNEYFAYINRWDIRIDLLILTPLVFIISAISIFVWCLGFFKKKIKA